jgi:hypothetical protein
MNILNEFFGDPLKHARTTKEKRQIRQPQRGSFRFVLSLLLATGAAFAYSFAADLLFGGFIGAYPTTAFLPAVTWSVISVGLILAAYALARWSRWLALPYAVFGTLAVLGGVVGAHLLDFIVAGAMFLHAFFVWKASGPPKAKAGRWDAVLNNCDLVMARDEIVVMHRRLNEEAKQKHGGYFWKNEYVAAWYAFRDDPNIETARAFLDTAPTALPYFESCSPGGTLCSTNRYFRERGQKPPLE